MPTIDATVVRLASVDLQPVWLRSKGFPSRGMQAQNLAAPATIRQVLEILFAIVQVQWCLERGHGVERFDDLVPIGTSGGSVAESHARRIGAFIVFALVAELRLLCSPPVRARGHANQTIAGLPAGVVDQAYSVVPL